MSVDKACARDSLTWPSCLENSKQHVGGGRHSQTPSLRRCIRSRAANMIVLCHRIVEFARRCQVEQSRQSRYRKIARNLPCAIRAAIIVEISSRFINLACKCKRANTTSAVAVDRPPPPESGCERAALERMIGEIERTALLPLLPRSTTEGSLIRHRKASKHPSACFVRMESYFFVTFRNANCQTRQRDLFGCRIHHQPRTRGRYVRDPDRANHGFAGSHTAARLSTSKSEAPQDFC